MRHGQVVAGVNASPRYDTHLEENAEAWGDKDPGLQPLEKAAWREWDLILVAGWRKGSLPGGNEGHSQRRRSRCSHKISKSVSLESRKYGKFTCAKISEGSNIRSD